MPKVTMAKGVNCQIYGVSPVCVNKHPQASLVYLQCVYVRCQKAEVLNVRYIDPGLR